MERSAQHHKFHSIIDLNERFFAVMYFSEPGKLNYEIIDKSTNAKMLSEAGRYISGLNDGKIVKINDKKITLMSQDLEILKEADFSDKYSHIEVINEHLVIAIEGENDIILMHFSNDKCDRKSCLNTCIPPISVHQALSLH